MQGNDLCNNCKMGFELELIKQHIYYEIFAQHHDIIHLLFGIVANILIYDPLKPLSFLGFYYELN
jgi:hypothetical protein